MSLVMIKRMLFFYAWVMAARPKTLTASLVPIMVGTALAAGTGVSISWGISFCALCVALAIQIGTNLVNDALDAKHGADTVTRMGPKRMTQSGMIPFDTVIKAGVGCLIASLVFGIPLMFYGGWPIALLLSVSALCGYLYTGGPAPLAYVGLGDLFVFLFFGLASTSAVYALQAGFWDIESLLAGVQIGLLATVMIAINNLRDHKGDKRANKNTLAVRFGPTFARYEIAALVFVPFIINIAWWFIDHPVAAVLPMVTLPMAYWLVRNVWNTAPSVAYNDFLARAALLHLAFGFLLSLGLASR